MLYCNNFTYSNNYSIRHKEKRGIFIVSILVSVHLPIPRLDDENKFYRDYFSHNNIWLDVSYDPSSGVIKSKNEDLFARNIQTITEIQMIENFEWMNISLLGSQTELVMSSNGKWHTLNENQLIDSICVYDISPRCSQCGEGFCKYTDEDKEDIECVCPIGRGGKNCQIDLCTYCKNGGYCVVNETSNQMECVCNAPFFGPYCESIFTTGFQLYLIPFDII